MFLSTYIVFIYFGETFHKTKTGNTGQLSGEVIFFFPNDEGEKHIIKGKENSYTDWKGYTTLWYASPCSVPAPQSITEQGNLQESKLTSLQEKILVCLYSRLCYPAHCVTHMEAQRRHCMDRSETLAGLLLNSHCPGDVLRCNRAALQGMRADR